MRISTKKELKSRQMNLMKLSLSVMDFMEKGTIEFCLENTQLMTNLFLRDSLLPLDSV
jgi:hypothetical protein